MTTSVELNEQSVPLKSEQPAEGNAETGAGAEAKPAKEKKSWFSGGKKKAAAAPEKTDEVNAPAEDGGAEQKKAGVRCPFRCFSRPTAAAPAEGGEQPIQPNYGIDLIHRNDRNLQTCIDLSYEDIYGEPDTIHSMDSVWRVNQKIFVGVRTFFYKLFALILFIPLAIVFGILFALVSAFSVFVCAPVGKLLYIPCNWILTTWSILTSAILNPIFNAVSLVFSNIKLTRYGLNTDTTAVIA